MTDNFDLKKYLNKNPLLNENDSSYKASQEYARLGKLVDRLSKWVSSHPDVVGNGEVNVEETDMYGKGGEYTIKFTKPGKLFKKPRTAEWRLWVDAAPTDGGEYINTDTGNLYLSTYINGNYEGRDDIEWGAGMFADDDKVYEKLVDEMSKGIMYVMYSQNR